MSRRIRRGCGISIGCAALAAAGAAWLALPRPERAAPLLRGTLHFDPAALPPARHAVGPYTLAWDTAGGGALSAFHDREPGRAVWSTLPGEAWLGAVQERLVFEESRGSFRVHEHRPRAAARQRLDEIRVERDRVVFAGVLTGEDGALAQAYSMAFRARGDLDALDLEVTLGDGPLDTLLLTHASAPDEHVCGFGEQFSALDMKGRRVPIWVQEQGIGRGLQPLTTIVDAVAGAGGSWHSTYAPVPHYLTSRARSFFLHGAGRSVFDLTAPDRIQVAVRAPMHGGILYGANPAELVSAYTRETGRMRPLPDWLLEGAVAGMQGGTARVREVLAQLERHGAPIAAFWLQDWQGQRRTRFGKQLWWNWQLDRERYPGWDELRADLAAKNIRLMGYINPFLVDIAGKTGHTRNLYREAHDRGYLVRDAHGAVLHVPNTDFSAAMADLSNPEAAAWLRGVIAGELIGAGLSGWMADFGEALPVEARMHDGGTGRDWHNRYPGAWAQLNREAIDAAGRGGDLVFFSRSGYTGSQRFSTLFWTGDQLVAWDAFDGMQTAVIALLSGGLAGFAFNHSDIGGYTTLGVPGLRYYRSKELLMRWMELNAFSVVFRTHEGNDPDRNVQFYSDGETLAQFARCAKLYAAWAPYRKQLVAEAAETGLPVVRPLFLHYPDDPAAWDEGHRTFLVGDAILVAPVMEEGADAVTAYLPDGRWVHLWSGAGYDGPQHVRIAAPLGAPAVFCRAGSEAGAALRGSVLAMGLAR